MNQTDEGSAEYVPYPNLRSRLGVAKAWKSELIALLNKLWEHGVDRIQEPGLRQTIDEFLRERVPVAFYLEPTSHGGKHHPAWQNGPNGTLRHIVESCILVPVMAQTVPAMLDCDKRVIQLAVDVVMAATIISDTFKTDDDGTSTKAEHGRRAAIAWREFALARHRTYPEIIERTARACEFHYGVFSPGWTEGQTLEPETQLVSIIDVLSSSKALELIYEGRKNIG